MDYNLNFTTERLRIRMLKKTDYQEWKRAYLQVLKPKNKFDESVIYEEDLTYPKFLNTVEKDMHSAKTGVTYNFTAFCNDSGEIRGDSQLWCVQRGECQRATMGFNVLNNYWRLGYGYEIGKATIEYGIIQMKLNRIEAEILPDNHPSVGLCKKLGMSYEGIKREALYMNGKWQDHLFFAITASDMGLSDRQPDLTFKSFI